MAFEPAPEHQWLEKLVGDWTCEGEAVMEPGKPPVKWATSETVRSIGGAWVMAENVGEMGCGHAVTITTLGYDEKKKRFVGTFIASMMTYLWIYEGSLDSSGNVLTLDTDGPNMDEAGKTASYQDIIEFKSDDHRTLTSRMQTGDGQWIQIMQAHYRRQK